MSDVKKRKVYTAAFKAKVGLEALSEKRTLNEIAQSYAVHPVQVSQWKREIVEGVPALFETRRGPKKPEESTDPERLYSEIGRLKMELDWLKKKSGMSLPA